MARVKDPLDAWQHAGLPEIDLPSGAGKATVKTLDLIDGIVLGKIPNALRTIALKVDASDFDPEDATDEELKDWSELRAKVVALATKKFNGKPVEFTPEWVVENLPPDDRDAIFGVATHTLSPKQRKGLMAFASFPARTGSTAAAEDSNGDGAGAE